MAELKLPRLPDRAPVKLAIVLTPNLHADLQAYADLYQKTYGVEESVIDLVPAMLANFLASDRAFAASRGVRK